MRGLPNAAPVHHGRSATFGSSELEDNPSSSSAYFVGHGASAPLIPCRARRQVDCRPAYQAI